MQSLHFCFSDDVSRDCCFAGDVSTTGACQNIPSATVDMCSKMLECTVFAQAYVLIKGWEALYHLFCVYSI